MDLTLLLEICSYITPLFCLPAALWGSYKLSRYKSSMFMKKRSLSLVYGLNILLIMAMIITVFINICLFHYGLSLITAISMILFIICWWILLFFLTVKNWMIYFKYKWTYFTLQVNWQQIINPNISEELKKTNWYIRNNHKYGNLKYICKLCNYESNNKSNIVGAYY